MNPRDGCVFGAASLARGIFVPLLDASLESEVPHLFSSMLHTSRRAAEMKKKKKRLLGPSEHKRSSHRVAWQWLAEYILASHERAPDL